MDHEFLEGPEEAVGLYFDLAPKQLVDLEVAAAAAIEWARGIRAAGVAIDSSYDYRVSLIAAEPGSSKWLARIERSKANQTAERLKRGWEKLPLVLRVAIGLGVVIPVTAVPTFKYWIGDESFSETQLRQMEEAYRRVAEDPTVKGHRQSMYGEVQRDRKIIGVGAGAPDKPDWKPKKTIPSDQFAEVAGLFEPQREVQEERTITTEMDVILVSPQLKNAPLARTFRQEGIPGKFNATMKDKKFLSALERSAVRESFRTEIPMRIRLQIKQRLVEGERKVKRQGRSVVEVISPRFE